MSTCASVTAIHGSRESGRRRLGLILDLECHIYTVGSRGLNVFNGGMKFWNRQRLSDGKQRHITNISSDMAPFL